MEIDETVNSWLYSESPFIYSDNNKSKTLGVER